MGVVFDCRWVDPADVTIRAAVNQIDAAVSSVTVRPYDWVPRHCPLLVARADNHGARRVDGGALARITPECPPIGADDPCADACNGAAAFRCVWLLDRRLHRHR